MPNTPGALNHTKLPLLNNKLQLIALKLTLERTRIPIRIIQRRLPNILLNHLPNRLPPPLHHHLGPRQLRRIQDPVVKLNLARRLAARREGDELLRPRRPDPPELDPRQLQRSRGPLRRHEHDAQPQGGPVDRRVVRQQRHGEAVPVRHGHGDDRRVGRGRLDLREGDLEPGDGALGFALPRRGSWADTALLVAAAGRVAFRDGAVAGSAHCRMKREEEGKEGKNKGTGAPVGRILADLHLTKEGEYFLLLKAIMRLI